MRMLGTISSINHAQKLSDYLLAQGMPAHVDEAAEGAQVWVEHDDHLERARAVFQEFASDPESPKFDASSKAEAIRKEHAKALERRRRNFRDVRTHQTRMMMQPTTWTIVLMAICIIVAVWTQLGSADHTPLLQGLLFRSFPGEFVEMEQFPGMLIPVPTQDLDRATIMFDQVLGGQVWRLFTPMLIHFGLIHILFNMMWLYSLGGLIERMRGPIFFLGLVLVSALVSNVSQAAWEPLTMMLRLPWADSAFVSFGGMSGVNYALFGFLWMRGKFHRHEGIALNPQIVGMMMAWLVICMIAPIGIANAAHVMGLVVGLVVGRWWK